MANESANGPEQLLKTRRLFARDKLYDLTKGTAHVAIVPHVKRRLSPIASKSCGNQCPHVPGDA